MNSNILSRISFLSLFLVVVLLPVFFLPFTSIPIESSKGIFLVVGLIVSLICWIVTRFFDGKINLPRSLPLLAGGSIVVASLLSALFSGASGTSLFGTMFDVGTFWFIFVAFLLMLLSSIIFREPARARIVLFGILLSSAVVLIFQTVHLFFPKVLSLGILNINTANVIGSWNAFGIFAAFFIIASMFVIEFFPVVKKIKVALVALSILSLVLIALVNFILVWEILGVFALLIFIYKISIYSNTKREEPARDGKGVQFPLLSLLIVLISLFFFMSASFIGGILPAKLKISNNEVGPSFTSTMSVTKSVLRTDPIFGLGPNRFGDAWALYKPAAINTTQFWDVSFNSGSGLLPTLTATTGLLGILSWVIFLALFIFTGVKWLFFSAKNNISFETVSFFFLSLFLFISSFFYFTGTVIFLLAMIFAGIFIGLVSSNTPKGEISIAFLDDHRKSFFSMLALVILVIICAGLGFKYIERFASIPYYTKTLTASDLPTAEASIRKAISLNSNDLYLRTYSQVYLLKLNSLISNKSSVADADKATLQTTLDQAISGAQVATNYNPKNYLNFQMLGTVYQTAGLIGVTDAYPKALEAYQKASTVNPGNPRLKLVLSNIAIALSDTKGAKEYANMALTLKPDYIDAFVTLAQIAKTEGNTSEAISYAEKALALAPDNKDLASYVQSLKNGNSTVVTPAPSTSEEDTSTQNQE